MAIFFSFVFRAPQPWPNPNPNLNPIPIPNSCDCGARKTVLKKNVISYLLGFRISSFLKRNFAGGYIQKIYRV